MNTAIIGGGNIGTLPVAEFTQNGGVHIVQVSGVPI